MSYAAFLQTSLRPAGDADSGYEDGDTPGLATGYSDGFTVADQLDIWCPMRPAVCTRRSWISTAGRRRCTRSGCAPRNRPCADLHAAVAFTDRVGFGYAYGSVGDDDGSKLVWHDGGFYTLIARYPDEHITVALLTNRESTPDVRTARDDRGEVRAETPEGAR